MKHFLFEWVGSETLSVTDIWPDGDAPENPTTEDVLAKIKSCGGIQDVIRNWNIGPWLEVEGQEVK